MEGPSTRNVGDACVPGTMVHYHEELCKPVTPFSVWPHLFSGAGHGKGGGEQLKWSLAFRLYIVSFPCAQLPGPVHTAQLDRVCFFVCEFDLGLCFMCPFVLFDLFVCPHSFVFS